MRECLVENEPIERVKRPDVREAELFKIIARGENEDRREVEVLLVPPNVMTPDLALMV